MYACLTTYKTTSTKEFSNKVNTSCAPQVSNTNGFIAFYGVDCGNGAWTSVCVCETKAQAEEANRTVTEFVKKNCGSFVTQGPTPTAGEVTASAMPGPGRNVKRPHAA